jgi:tRNA(Ile)-lysidine synthase
MNGSVLEAVRARGIVSPSAEHVALVSGGRDSVCLLDVLVSICGPERITALHLNYGLRGAESDGDERHVRELCEALGVALVCVRAPAAPVRGNLQAWARDQRYAHAIALSPVALIATGHTASDQAETVLYRLAASPGRRALLGMAPREGRLVRPLLGLTREQTAEHCLARGLRWRDDRSNDSRRFARARVRHGVLPELREVHPAAVQNLLRSVEILRAEAEVLDEVVDVALAGRQRIALTRLAELPAALARLVVIRLAEEAAGEPVGGMGARLDELLALAGAGGSASLDVGAGTRAIVEYGVLRFATDRRSAAAAAPQEQSLSVPGAAAFGEWSLRATLEAVGSSVGAETVEAFGRTVGAESVEAFASRAGAERVEAFASRAGAERVEALRTPGEAETVGELAVLDADRLRGGPLTVRAWRAGDRMSPLGLDGSKSLADLFGDRRIPRAERSSLPIVLSEGRVAWIPRVATGEQFRVHAQTRRLAVLSATPGAPVEASVRPIH